jgi:hypothetical protein
MFSFSAVPSCSAPNVPDRALAIIVAGVWPPRKRDFLPVPAPIKRGRHLSGRFAPRGCNA